MSEFKTRLQSEISDLEVKIEKLFDFIENNDAFKDLPKVQQSLSQVQLNAMFTYQRCLRERISYIE